MFVLRETSDWDFVSRKITFTFFKQKRKMVKTISLDKTQGIEAFMSDTSEYGPRCRVHHFCNGESALQAVGSGKPCSYMSRQSSRRSSCCPYMEPPFLDGKSSSSERTILVVAKLVHCSKVLHFKLLRFGTNLHDGMSHLRDINLGHTLSLGDVKIFAVDYHLLSNVACFKAIRLFLTGFHCCRGSCFSCIR